MAPFPTDQGGDHDQRDCRHEAGRAAPGESAVPPQGGVKRKITLRGNEPTNPTFGGPDGKTVFVTQSEGGFIEAFRRDRRRREPCLQMPTVC
jgi:signal peptidase